MNLFRISRPPPPGNPKRFVPTLLQSGCPALHRAKSSLEPLRPASNMVSMQATPSIQTDVQVMFFDTDCAAVVHNIAYLRFIEVARTLLAEQLGLGLVEMAASKLYPVVVRTEIDYLRPARLGDHLQVHGQLHSIERSRFWCRFEIRRPADQTLLVTSRQMLALVQMPQGRPVRLPADWSIRFEHLRPSPSGAPADHPPRL